MKHAKQIMTAALSLLLLLPTLTHPAYADTESPSEETSVAQDTPAAPAVNTLDELQAAIAAAADGATLYIGSTINIIDPCIIGMEEKRITIKRSETLPPQTVFRVSCEDAVLQNLIIDGEGFTPDDDNGICDISLVRGKLTMYNVTVQNSNCALRGHSLDIESNTTVIIDDCVFKDSIGAFLEIFSSADVKITGSSFERAHSTVHGGAIQNRGTLEIDDCLFAGNSTVFTSSVRTGGAIENERNGTCTIADSLISGNTSNAGGGICNWGTLRLSDTLIYDNHASNMGADVFSTGQLDIEYSNELSELYHADERTPDGFYRDNLDNRFDAESNITEKVDTPISGAGYNLRFVFSDELPFDEAVNDAPADSADDVESEIPPSDSAQSDDEASDDISTGNADTDTHAENTQPDTLPEDSPAEEVQDDTPIDNPPAKSDEKESPADETPSQQTTAVDTAPITTRYYPPVPIETITPDTRGADSTDDESSVPQPAEEVHTPAPPFIVLAHGGITLDTKTPLALHGYNDGQLHENDPMTRAQIAVLLYRALDNDSNATGEALNFADVERGAWYYDAVSALSSAGIVNGCGGQFNPGGTLTYGQLIAILTRFVDAKTAPMPDSIIYQSHWSYNNIVTAVAYGWIDDATAIDPDAPITRGDAVKIINSVFAMCQ